MCVCVCLRTDSANATRPASSDMEPSGVGDHWWAKVVGKSRPARDFAAALTRQVHANRFEEHMTARMKSLCESNEVAPTEGALARAPQCARPQSTRQLGPNSVVFL